LIAERPPSTTSGGGGSGSSGGRWQSVVLRFGVTCDKLRVLLVQLVGDAKVKSLPDTIATKVREGGGGGGGEVFITIGIRRSHVCLLLLLLLLLLPSI